MNIFKNTAFQIVAGVIVLACIAWGSVALLSRHDQNYATTTVARRDLVETVTAAGTVAPAQSSELAFDMSGKVAAVYADAGMAVKQGQVLAALDSGTLRAQLDGARADLMAADAKLADMEAGATPEELAVYQQKYTAATTALISAMKSAYLSVEDAIIGKADLLMSNGDTVNPTLVVPTVDQGTKVAVQNDRVNLRDVIVAWKTSLDRGEVDSGRAATANALAQAKSYADELATVANALTPANSGFSQTDITAYQSDASGAAQEISAATASYQSVDSAYGSAHDALVLEQAGSTKNALAAEQAVVAKAQSAVEAIQSQLSNSVITAPFDGLITHMDMKVGQVFVPGMPGSGSIGIQSAGAYKVEVYVPETDVAKLSVGQHADVTIDAYGPNVDFPATVAMVDPAPTTVNGADGYKVTVDFDQPDARIKSGMTANVSVTTESAPNAVAVPSSSIITRGASRFVLGLNLNGSGFVERPVTVGISTDDGYTEIVSGLSAGDSIATFGNNQ